MAAVIVGNSIAGLSAAQALRARDPAAALTIVTDEPHPYHSRCALMYYLMDKCDRRDTFIADRQFYRDLKIDLVQGRAVGLDLEARRLELEDGGGLPYDQLLLATGAAPRALGVPGEDARGIFTFTSLVDCDRILDRLPSCRRAAVIGGGLIGIEVVEALRHLGLAVDYLYREERFYPPFCSKEQSAIIEDRMRAYGVGLHPGVEIAGFEVGEGGQVRAVAAADGASHPCDLAVVAIGVEPRVGFAAEGGLEVASGILVDEGQRASVPGVFAAGDCAEVPHPRLGRVVQKLWYTAGPQGAVAGENMAGGAAVYDASRSYQAAMFMDLHFCSVGDMPSRRARLNERTFVGRGGFDAVRVICDEDDRVVGASSVGRAVEKRHLDRLVGGRVTMAEAEGEVERLLGRRGLAPMGKLPDRPGSSAQKRATEPAAKGARLRRRGAFRTWFWALAAAVVAMYLVIHILHPPLFGLSSAVWYEILYSAAVLVGGLVFLRRYRHRDAYMTRRTAFNIAAQLAVGSTLPLVWNVFAAPADRGLGLFVMYLWPLEIYSVLAAKVAPVTPAVKVFLVYGVVAGLLVMPVLVYFLGRRPYCSWFCGCGCLAETLGDGFRRLTPRGRLSRRVEPVIYIFVVAAIALTIWTLAAPSMSADAALAGASRWYELVVKFFFASLVGVGLYSLRGARIWCRYVCPWAGLFGLIARHGRYAIDTRRELCIGCGQCNTYCEMGIDIRGFAMRGEPVKTTTCVGCGMCIEKCPRRVLSFRPTFGRAA